MGQQQQKQQKLQQQRQRQRWLYNNANFNGHYNEAITIKNAEQQRSSRDNDENDDGDTIMIRIYWAYGAY